MSEDYIKPYGAIVDCDPINAVKESADNFDHHEDIKSDPLLTAEHSDSEEEKKMRPSHVIKSDFSQEATNSEPDFSQQMAENSDSEEEKKVITNQVIKSDVSQEATNLEPDFGQQMELMEGAEVTAEHSDNVEEKKVLTSHTIKSDYSSHPVQLGDSGSVAFRIIMLNISF